MNRALIVALAMLLSSISSAWAHRVIEQTEDAYELVLGEVSLPRRASGWMIFMPCPACTVTSLRVTSATTYFVNGVPLEFPEFLEAVEAIRRISRGEQSFAVYVFFDMESRRINRLKIDHFEG